MAASELSRYIVPNVYQDPTIALQSAQAAQFAAQPQLQGSIERQAYGVEYQVPTAVRFGMPLVVGSPANNIGVTNPVGNSTGPSPTFPSFPSGGGVTSIIAGANITVDQPTGTVTISATGGSGSPGGSPGDVQFNDTGTFGGDSGFTYDGAGAAALSAQIDTPKVLTDNLAPHTPPGAFGVAELVLEAHVTSNPSTAYIIRAEDDAAYMNVVMLGSSGVTSNNDGGPLNLSGGSSAGTGDAGHLTLGGGFATGSGLDGSVVISNSRVPTTASDTGTQGAIAYDSGFIYVCTATNTWKRVAIATF